jgi:hypothetical protein
MPASHDTQSLTERLRSLPFAAPMPLPDFCMNCGGHLRGGYVHRYGVRVCFKEDCTEWLKSQGEER